jgi:hypothetical protein
MTFACRYPRARSGAIDDGAPELRVVDSRRLDVAGEADFRHRTRADHVEPDGDARSLPRRIHAHVVEPAERKQMQHGLADLAHGQRLPGVNIDDARQRRVGRVPAVEHEADGHHGLPEIVRHVSARWSGRREDTCGDDACPPKRLAKVDVPKPPAKAHQNECRTRNSSAYVC